MTIHALATGKYFYQADSAWETYQKILETRVDMSEIEATEDELFIDFLRQILQRCPKKRLTAKQALKHPWFPIEVQRSASLTPATLRARVPTASAGARRKTQSPPERFRSWREEIDEPKNKTIVLARVGRCVNE